MMEGETTMPVGRCDGCETEHGPFLKLSMGKDFFGRAYDRLSPSADHSPKWYCESCSMHKNLQRDVRDIRSEMDKLAAGQHSELAVSEQMQRARLRLHEISTILQSEGNGSRLLNAAEVLALSERLHAHAAVSSA
ncbi:hypothetical protein [Candidatus Nitrospira bockiana]